MQDKQALLPPKWDKLPDVELYMDQVTDYLERRLPVKGPTSSMVHNYIKSQLLPRPEGKRYTKEHLARLTAVCILKQVLPIEDVGRLLPQSETERFYDDMVDMLAQELAEAERLAQEGQDSLPLRLALSAYARQALCLELMQETEPEEAPRRKRDKAERVNP